MVSQSYYLPLLKKSELHKKADLFCFNVIVCVH